VNALEESLSIEVEGYAQGTATCSGGHCEAEGEAGCTCSTPGSSPPGRDVPGTALALGALGAAIAVRKLTASRGKGRSPSRK
jgi:MYXO-CTERM domain-containing protein